MEKTLLDGTGSAFFQRELEHIKAASYDVLYTELTYDKVFPVDNEPNPGATSVTFHTYDRRGMAKIINNYADDIPRVDVDGVETTVPVRTVATSFGYTIHEIKASQMVGKQLDRKRAMAARKAVEEVFNSVAWTGDAAAGLYGVMTHPNIPSGNAPDPGAGTEWSNKTAVQIRDDINLMFRTVFTGTNSVESADTLLLPPAQWSLVMETALSADNSKTIAQWFVENSPYINSKADIINVPELAGAGTGGADVGIVMTRRADKVEFVIPEDVTFHPEQQQLLEYVTPVTGRCGGLNVYYPLSMYILELI